MMFEATPKDEGYEAFHLGVAKADCPHPPRTKEEEQWLKGWELASRGGLSYTDTFD